jgi:hypothetical protein
MPNQTDGLDGPDRLLGGMIGLGGMGAVTLVN